MCVHPLVEEITKGGTTDTACKIYTCSMENPNDTREREARLNLSWSSFSNLQTAFGHLAFPLLDALGVWHAETLLIRTRREKVARRV